MLAVWVLILVAVIFLITKSDKHGYLYAFFAIYPYMPEAFAIRLGGLPRITFARVLIVWLCCMYILKNQNQFKLYCKKPFRNLPFLLFVCLILAEMLVNLVTASTGVNHFIGFVLEKVFLPLLVISIIDSKTTFDKCLKYLAAGGTVLFLFGIIQTFTDINLAQALFVLKEDALQVDLPSRMGLTRASVTVSGILHGYYAVFLLPILYYLKVTFRDNKYLICMLIAAAASVCTMTRGAILFVFIEMVVFVILEVKRGKTSRQVVSAVAAMLVVFIPVIVFICWRYRDFVQSIIDMIVATVNVFNSGFEYNSAEINNSVPIQSRLGQLTVFIWIFNNGRLLTGYGDGALEEILLKYISPTGEWYNMYALDCGYAAMAGFGGILQVAAYLLLFGSLLIYYFKKTKGKSPTVVLLFFVMVLFFATNFATVFYDNKLAVLLLALALTGKFKQSVIEQ